MGTWFNAQIDTSTGEYTLQFGTNDKGFFKRVERECQKAVDASEKARQKERCRMTRTTGHL